MNKASQPSNTLNQIFLSFSMICALCIQTSSAADIKVGSYVNVVGRIKGPLKIGTGLHWDRETLSLFLSPACKLSCTPSTRSLLLLSLPSDLLLAWDLLLQPQLSAAGGLAPLHPLGHFLSGSSCPWANVWKGVPE